MALIGFIAVVGVIAAAFSWAVLSWHHHGRPVVRGPRRVLIAVVVGTVVAVAAVVGIFLKIAIFCDPPNCF
jgi:hypothetical protein